jgi:hypothetical protein
MAVENMARPHVLDHPRNPADLGQDASQGFSLWSWMAAGIERIRQKVGCWLRARPDDP